MPVTLSIQVKGADIVRRGLQNLKAEIPKIGAQRIYEAMLRVRKKLKAEGKAIRYPVNWDSEAQRIKVMAMLRKRGNLPYARTGAYNRGWSIRRNPSGDRARVGYSLVNESPYARYVGGSAYGDGQSKIHRGRWVCLRDVMEQEVGRLPQTIEDHITMVARREIPK